MRDTIISVGDDCIAINSGKSIIVYILVILPLFYIDIMKDEDGVIVGIPAVNHTFENVTCLNGHGYIKLFDMK